MSDVNIKRFVNINIKPHVVNEVSSTRETVVLFTPDGTLGTVKHFERLSEVTYSEDSDTYKYLKCYFDNGGIKVDVYEGISYDDLDDDILLALPNELICIACVSSDANIQDCYDKLSTLAIQMQPWTYDLTNQPAGRIDDVYGINEKIILARNNEVTYDNDGIPTKDNRKITNFAVKYSTVVGAEMTIAAYLSQIDINKINSVQDYCFTEENIVEEDITDAIYGDVQDVNMNVDIYLSGAVRNCGGNCKDGYDLTNSYVKIILHQTLTAQLIQLLTQKIKSSDGVSKIYAVISQELEKYKNCGYLTTDKIWNDKSLLVSYNGETYTIVNKGDALLNGYIVKILPISSLSSTDKSNHSTPPIYIIIADQYGIRKITINGEII